MQRLTLFHGTEQLSPQIDTSFFELDIPSGTDLYREMIARDQYELVSELSFSAITKILLDKGCNIKDLPKAHDVSLLSDTHYHYIFHFEKMDDFAARERLITILNELRHAAANKNTLFLDADTLSLHFYEDCTFDFCANERVSMLSNAYRALCIYDLIVEELYRHNLKREDKNYTNSLISDYLSIHSYEFLVENKRDLFCSHVANRLRLCLKTIPCDRRSAAALHWGFNRISWSLMELKENKEKIFNRAALMMIPLTPEACLNAQPNKKVYGELTYDAHYYCSLIQYRYLMDLKSLFSSVSKNTLQQIKDHMKKWGSYKTQPVILKYEALINKIQNIFFENRANNDNAYDCLRGDDLYWEEGVSSNGDGMVCIKAFGRGERSLKKDFSLKMQKKLQEKLQPILNVERHFTLHTSHPQHDQSYYLAVNQKDLAKCPLKKLLTYRMYAIQILNNPVLDKLTLSNLQFFKTIPCRNWISYWGHPHSKYDAEMREFVFLLAAWLMIEEWGWHQRNAGMLMDVLLVMTNFLKELLIQEYKHQLSKS
jgi:hypothetical protein